MSERDARQFSMSSADRNAAPAFHRPSAASSPRSRRARRPRRDPAERSARASRRTTPSRGSIRTAAYRPRPKTQCPPEVEPGRPTTETEKRYSALASR
jgi:hypothetical protein